MPKRISLKRVFDRIKTKKAVKKAREILRKIDKKLQKR